MGTTLRVRQRDKDRLRRLQERWRRVRGATPTQQDLFGTAIEYVERHSDAFIAEASWTPLSPKEISALKALQKHYGPGASDRVDEIVYGTKARR